MLNQLPTNSSIWSGGLTVGFKLYYTGDQLPYPIPRHVHI